MKLIYKKMKFALLLLVVCYTNFLTAADIAVVSIAWGDDYKESVRLGTENKSYYCQHHGYDFIYSEESEDPSRNIYWSKILLTLKALENPAYKWVVWMDADTLIMNTDVPLEDIIDEGYQFMISKDWNGINSGVFFIKNGPWAKDFLENVYTRTDCINTWWPEQIAIAKELEKPEFGPFAKIVPSRMFNSYPKELLPHPSLTTLFQPGDFILHFASVKGSNGPLASLFEKYAPQVLHDRTLITLDTLLGVYGFQLSPTHSSYNEGYMSNEQRKQFEEQLALHPDITSVIEIGLNGGHSANTFFQNCKNLKRFLSFDINMHAYTPVAVEYFRRVYKNIFEFVPGDSTITVPQYTKAFPNEKFDLIYIDGGHSYQVCYNDLLNCQKFAHPGTLVWVDDYYGGDIPGAIHTLQNEGVLELVTTHSSWGPNGGRAWAEVRYLP